HAACVVIRADGAQDPPGRQSRGGKKAREDVEQDRKAKSQHTDEPAMRLLGEILGRRVRVFTERQTHASKLRLQGPAGRGSGAVRKGPGLPEPALPAFRKTSPAPRQKNRRYS